MRGRALLVHKPSGVPAELAGAHCTFEPTTLLDGIMEWADSSFQRREREPFQERQRGSGVPLLAAPYEFDWSLAAVLF